MTDTSTLRAESRALVSYGVERYEDAVTYSAIRRYLDDIGAIPSGVWGTLPVSDQLRRDWSIALDSRVDESLTAKDEMDRMADGLLQIATDYEHTDLSVATSFDVVNRDLQPYLAVADGYTSTVGTRLGGAGVVSTAQHHRPDPDDRSALVIPPGNDRLTATRHEVLPSTRVVEEPLVIGSSDGNDLGFSGGRTTYYDNGEHDQLDEFVQQYRSELLQLEAILTDLGTSERLPLSDLIIHAWRSSPKVIRNRADLIHSVGNTYGELRTNMDADTHGLALYWEGTAASAFTQYAENASTYLGQIQAQADWLAEEGKKAASLLEGLRNAYAVAGFERIGTLIEAMQAYRENVHGLFSSCSNPEKAFLDTVSAFVGYLADAERRHVELLATLIKIDEQERHERPDLGGRGHDTVPFPAPAVGSNAWTQGNGWKPNPTRPTT
ncbi:hypothetical protein [Krasilnikovia sp. MM14-A1259]|uniref:hypothetical protein n=1 Tax=Krasilnikovia sp. MM14-A1259 TaxID=3373539 RepID=UPI00382FEDBA